MESPIFQALFLGVVQGLTEFLPVSSSGHLALAQQLIPGFEQPGILLDVLLHVGTLAAVVAYFWRDLMEMAFQFAKWPAGTKPEPETVKLVLGVIIASVPTAAVGLFLEEEVEHLMMSREGVGAALILTAALLAGGAYLGARVARRPGNPLKVPSFFIGVAQGMAVIPGISRSGATISTARAFGVDPEAAARFSFLAALPAVGGAALITVAKNMEAIKGFGTEEVIAYILGPVVAAAVGYGAIAVVMRMLRRGSFKWFSVYCLVLGIAAVISGLVS